MGIPSVGLGLSGVDVAGAVHGEAGDVEYSLSSLPQQSQKQSGAASGLVDGPDDLISEGEDFVDKTREISLVICYLTGEELFSRSVKHVGPVELFARVDSGPGSVHDHLRSSVGSSPVESPADGSLCSEFSPISMSGRSLQRDRGAILIEPSDGGVHKAILGPYGRHPDTVPERHA
jgi:hypothetical protein